MTTYRFLEPLDVLFLRGNKLFGDPGSYGESLVPPWPSVAAGAIRSQMLAVEGRDLAAFAAGSIDHPQLGTPQRPGSFAVESFTLARRVQGAVESLHVLPADLVVTRKDEVLHVHRLMPAVPAPGIASSAFPPMMPTLASDSRSKPVSGLWLSQAGWQQYLAGQLPEPQTLVEANRLWKLDPRVGVGLDAQKRCAEEGKLFTVQAVAFEKDVGFLVGVDGAEPPASGSLRLGGDGRAAAVSTVEHRLPETDFSAIAAAARCRVVLTAPGIFPEGWRLPGMDGDRFSLGGVRGRLACAAVARAEVVSGWDLARWQPKPAQRAAPAGSVYWLDELDATPDALRKLAEAGLWGDSWNDPQRRAEGFNRVALAPWAN
jgi:CRISPR-associated protein Cmr3